MGAADVATPTGGGPIGGRVRVRARRLGRLTARQVDVVLEVLLVTCGVTGFAVWTLGTGWVRWLAVTHATSGLTVLVLAAAKLRGSVRTGMRRGRISRWFSLIFGVGVLGTIGLGLSHSTGLWSGVGAWSALWTHVLVGTAVVPLLVWHAGSRPSRPRLSDLDRRAVLRGGLAVTAGAVVYALQETAVRTVTGPSRRPTGSHPVADHEPHAMPTVSWLDDRPPAEEAVATWELTVAGREVDLDDLRRASRPLTATVDCTGGWASTQRWDAVPLGTLLGDQRARSIRVTSSTGYSRLLPDRDRDHLFLAVGYGGRPLRAGHGAPVRLVAPGRRGPWWVKWVRSVEPDDRPWWLQLPLPLE